MATSAVGPSPELALLLRCAGASAEGSTYEIERLTALIADWPRVFELAARHAVIPLVSRQLARTTPGMIPADTMASFRSAARQGALRGLQLAGQLVSVIRELERRGIDAIPVKGPTLAVLVYRDLSLRLYEDLDVLVRREDVGRSRDALRDLGFRSAPRVFNDSRDSLLPLDHQESFIHVESSIPFELHWSLNHRTLAHDPLETRWWRGRQTVDLGGAAIRTLGPEPLLLYLCMHGAKHSWARVGWLCDLHRSLQYFGDVEWELVWRMARENGAVRMMNVGLILVDEMLDGTTSTSRAFARQQPDRISRALAARIRDRLLHSPDYVPDLDFTMQIRLRDRLRDRVRYAIHILAEPWPADISALELPRSLRGAYYIFRPLRLAWKHLLHRAHDAPAV